MTILLIFTASFFLGIGTYSLICAFSDIPTKETSKMMLLTQKQQGTRQDNMLDVYLTKVAERLSFFVPLDNIRRNTLLNTLSIAGINLTPQTYVMKAFLTAFLTALTAIPVALVMPFMSFFILGMSVLLWFSSYSKAFDMVKKRKKNIELELPRFAASIKQSLSTDRDVLKLLLSYRKTAGTELGRELDITIADMKTGNYENALLRFQNRIGSTMLSDIIRGLIGTLRGDDEQLYFQMLVFDMRQIEQNNLKKEAAKRPKQMERYSMLMLFAILLIYLVVLSIEVVSSLSSFF